MKNVSYHDKSLVFFIIIHKRDHNAKAWMDERNYFSESNPWFYRK